MASVQDHYESHLAPLYTWIAGGAAGPRARFTELLATQALRPSAPEATALDLGAGSGFQSLPLAAARDTATAAVPVRTVLGDLRDLTLTHDDLTAGLATFIAKRALAS